MNEHLLVLGAGKAQTPALERAVEMGLKVSAIDQNPEAPGFEVAHNWEPIDIVDVDKAVEFAREQAIDGVLPSGDVSLPTAAAINAEVGLSGIGPETAEVATTKERYRERFKDNNVPYPVSETVSSVEEAEEVASKVGYPLIAKPSLSFGGSRGVIRVDDPEELNQGIRHAMSETRDGHIILEEFLDGREHTVESIVIDGDSHTLATSDKERIVDSYCVATSLNYPSQANKTLRNQMSDIAQRAAEAIGLENGATHIEVVQAGDKLKLIDFGARGGGASFIPARIVPEVSEVDMIEKMINISLGRPVPEIPEPERHGIVFRFFTPEPGEVTDIRGVPEVDRRDDVLQLDLPIEVGDEIPPVTTQLDRSGSFVVKGHDGDAAIEKAERIQETVEIVTES